MKTFKYSKLVRVCDRGVIRYKQSKDVKDANRKGPGVEASQEGGNKLQIKFTLLHFFLHLRLCVARPGVLWGRYSHCKYKY